MKPADFAIPKALQFTPPYGAQLVKELGSHFGLDADEERVLSSRVDELIVAAVYDALTAAGVHTHTNPDCPKGNKPHVVLVDDDPGEGVERRITCPRCNQEAEKAERKAGGSS